MARTATVLFTAIPGWQDRTQSALRYELRLARSQQELQAQSGIGDLVERKSGILRHGGADRTG
jgi:hypothetical protein